MCAKLTPFLCGERFGMLTIVSVVQNENKRTWYKCLCECGKSVTRTHYSLASVNHKMKSCGCFRFLKTHGLSESRLKSIWKGMKRRCNDKKYVQFKDYGGRGISVCERWLSFSNFIKDVGQPPGKEFTLDRIDNNKGYEPGNVKWSTKIEQASNTRRNVYIFFEGEKLTASQCARKFNIPVHRILWRKKNGWDDKDVIEKGKL